MLYQNSNTANHGSCFTCRFHLMLWIGMLGDLIRFSDSKKHTPGIKQLWAPRARTLRPMTHPDTSWHILTHPDTSWLVLTRYSIKERNAGWCLFLEACPEVATLLQHSLEFTWSQSPQVGIINLNGVITVLYEPQWIPMNPLSWP